MVLNFEQISNMPDVQDFIRESEFRKSQYYFVYFHDGFKGKGNSHVIKNTLKFGNEDADFLDRVIIRIYKDTVILNRNGDGHDPYERDLDLNKEYTDERLIFEALLVWAEYDLL